MRRSACLGIVFIALNASAAAAETPDEVLARDSAQRPTLVRVALPHALPGWAESRVALGGTWSFLLADGPSVVIHDVGPRHPLLWSLLPWAAPKRFARHLDGNERLMRALDAYFPGRAVSQILLGHWHADHVEAAPELQRLARSRWGHTPPLRIAEADRPERQNAARGAGRAVPAGAEAVFRTAGFRPGDWRFGRPLRHGERIGATGFRAFALPGHTLGHTVFVDATRRLVIGTSVEAYDARRDAWGEDPEARVRSIARLRAAYPGARCYTSHPGRADCDAL